MAEGQRFYDGTLAPQPGPNELGDCPQTTVAYESVPGPDVRPRIVFWNNTQPKKVIEIRDYRPTTVTAGVMFNVVDIITTPFLDHSGTTVKQRVTVVAFYNGVPQFAIYYDQIGPGRVTVDFPA